MVCSAQTITAFWWLRIIITSIYTKMKVVHGREDPFESHRLKSTAICLQYCNYIKLNTCNNHWASHCHSSRYYCTITPLFYVFIITGKWFCWLKSDGFRRYDNSLSCKILAPWESPVGVMKVRPSCLGADQDGNTMWHSKTLRNYCCVTWCSHGFPRKTKLST